MTEGRRRTVLAVLVFANFTQLGARLLVSPVVPDVLAQFAVSKAWVGAALTGMWAAYALAQFPGGLLADRTGERRMVLAALAATGAGSLLLAVAPSFPVFAVCAVLLGAGAGVFFPAAASLLSRLYEGRGRALGYLTAGGSLAGLAAPVAAAVLAVAFGWRVALLPGAALAFPAVALVAWQVPAIDGTEGDRGSVGVADGRAALARLRVLFRRPSVVYTTGVAIAVGFTWQSFASFFPTFLTETGLATQRTAGVAFGAVFLLSAVAQPAMGRVSDATSRDTALAASVLVTATGFAVVLAGDGLATVAAATLLLGAGISWPGVVQARFMDQLSTDRRGTEFGLVRTVYMFLASAGSAVTGVLADVAGWTAAYGLVVGLLVVVAVALGLNTALGLDL